MHLAQQCVAKSRNANYQLQRYTKTACVARVRRGNQHEIQGQGRAHKHEIGRVSGVTRRSPESGAAVESQSHACRCQADEYGRVIAKSADDERSNGSALECERYIETQAGDRVALIGGHSAHSVAADRCQQKAEGHSSTKEMPPWHPAPMKIQRRALTPAGAA
jgi:hypothetical protein